MTQLALTFADSVAAQRFPIEPLATIWQREHPDATLDQLRRELAINGPTWHRMQAHGMTVAQADRYAVRLGRHPCEIWDNWW